MNRKNLREFKSLVQIDGYCSQGLIAHGMNLENHTVQLKLRNWIALIQPNLIIDG